MSRFYGSLCRRSCLVGAHTDEVGEHGDNARCETVLSHEAQLEFRQTDDLVAAHRSVILIISGNLIRWNLVPTPAWDVQQLLLHIHQRRHVTLLLHKVDRRYSNIGIKLRPNAVLLSLHFCSCSFFLLLILFLLILPLLLLLLLISILYLFLFLLLLLLIFILIVVVRVISSLILYLFQTMQSHIIAQTITGALRHWQEGALAPPLWKCCSDFVH